MMPFAVRYTMQSIGTHTKLWYLVDARNQVAGRLAAMLALLLQGKTKPIYHPASECDTSFTCTASTASVARGLPTAHKCIMKYMYTGAVIIATFID